MRAAPVLPLAAALACGIAAAELRAVGPGPMLALAAAAFAGSLVAAARAWPRPAAMCLLAGIAALGIARAAGTPMPPHHVGRLAASGAAVTATLDGRLRVEPVRPGTDRTRILLDVDGVDDGAGRRAATGLVQLTLYGEPPPLGEGQRLEVRARLSPPASFRNPGGFDYAAHLRRDGILLVGSAPAERVAALGPDDPPAPVRVRRWAVRAIGAALPEASAALLAGLLLGERTALPRELDEAFRRAGAYHVLAVSGFNVALVAASVLGLLALAGMPRRARLAASAGALVGFAAVVGPQPSVIRATLMGLLLLGAALLDRESQARNALALAALILLVARPGELWEPGFQLSFAATAGIVHVAGPLAAALAACGAPRGLALAVATSAAAQAALLPVMLVHFNQLSLVGLVANLAVVPLAGLATLLGMLALGAALVTDAVAALVWPALWLVLLALRAVVWAAAALPAAMVHLPAPPAAAVLGWAAALALVPLAAGRRRVGAAAAALALTAIALAAWPWLRPEDARLRITMLDVGQGEAIFVEVPGGGRLLVDGGPGGPRRLDAGERVVAPFLWNRPVASLHAVALTHPDADHAGGLAAVLRHFRIGEWWDTGRWSAAAGDTRRALDRSGVPRRELSAGARHRLGDAVVTVLGPAAAEARDPAGPAPSARATLNDESLVLRLDWRGVSVLLTGDLTRRGEARLLEAGAPLRAQVLKVAHHGSRSSTAPAFLDAVAPGVALVSTGRRNPFGHPAPEVLERLERAGVRVYRTDRDGALVLATDGTTLEVTRWATGRTDTLRLDAGGGDTAAPGETAPGAAGGTRGAREGAAL